MQKPFLFFQASCLNGHFRIPGKFSVQILPKCMYECMYILGNSLASPNNLHPASRGQNSPPAVSWPPPFPRPVRKGSTPGVCLEASRPSRATSRISAKMVKPGFSCWTYFFPRRARIQDLVKEAARLPAGRDGPGPSLTEKRLLKRSLCSEGKPEHSILACNP